MGQHHLEEFGARALGNHLEGNLRRIARVWREEIDRSRHSNRIRIWWRAKLLRVKFRNLELRETLSGFFWVLGKEYSPDFIEFSGQSRVGKSGGEVRQQCSFGVAAQLSGGVDYCSQLAFSYSSPSACSLPCASPGAICPINLYHNDYY